MIKKMIVGLVVCFTHAYAIESNFTLNVGQQKVLHLANIQKISIPHPEVADIQISKNSERILVTGISRGETDLTFWNTSGKSFTIHIKVKNSSGGLKLKTLQSLLLGVEGVRIKQEGKSFFISGDLYRSEDYTRVLRVEKAYSNVFANCQMAKSAKEYLVTNLEQQLLAGGYYGIRPFFRDNTLVLSGPPKPEKEAVEIEYLALAIYPAVENLLYTKQAPGSQFFLDLQFLEVRKHHNTDVGISYPSAITANGQLSFSGTNLNTSLLISPNVAMSLKALTDKGIAKVLSNPKLLCKNGIKTTFTAGGEIPIRLISERAARVEFKEYGIEINVIPHVDGSQITMNLDMRVSDLDASTAVDGIPGILEHKLRTIAEAKIGETVVLGGLLENRVRKNISKVPFFGQIPILGELFKSRSFQNNDSELLLTITPLIGDTAAKTHQDLLKSVVRVKNMKKEFNFSLAD